MNSIQRNLSIFNKFKLERPPVGVKFLPNKPDGVKRLDKILRFFRDCARKKWPLRGS